VSVCPPMTSTFSNMSCNNRGWFTVNPDNCLAPRLAALA
jgi:hypothetical protein